MNYLQTALRNASRCADIIRIASARSLATELLEQGYTDTWLAYTHCTTVIRTLESKRNYRRAGVWDERRALYRKANAAIWEEMKRRGLRQEVPIPTPLLTQGTQDGRG